MIASNLFLQLTYSANVVLAGSLNSAAKLAGVGLATTLLSVVIFTPFLGMNGAVETLVSQAYGAGQLRLCGIYLNRGRLINTIILVPLLVMLYFCRELLEALGQDR